MNSWNIPTIVGGWDVVLMDPPWKYYGDANKDQAAGKHYDCLTFEQLSSLPIKDITHKNSVVFCWTTSPMMAVSIDLLRSLGLHYRGISFVWIKTSKQGRVVNGQGARPSVVKSVSEYVICGSFIEKGRPLPLSDEGVWQVLHEEVEEAILCPRPGNKHSKKPDAIRDRIYQLYDFRRSKIELFARELASGWTSWGDQLKKEQE